MAQTTLPTGVIDRLIAVQETRAKQIRGLPEAGRAAIEDISALFGTEDLSEFLFSPIRSLGAAPIDLLATGEPEKIALLNLHIERIAAGVYV